MTRDSTSNMTDTELWSLCKLGYQLYARGRYADARSIFEGLVALDDQLEYPWHALGLVARKCDDPARAEECLRRRLELAPDADASRVELAEVLYETGRVEEALSLLDHFHPPDGDSSPAARRGRVLRERWS